MKRGSVLAIKSICETMYENLVVETLFLCKSTFKIKLTK